MIVPPAAFLVRFRLSAATKSRATDTGGPFTLSGFHPCATARINLACAGDLLGIGVLP